MNLNNIEYQGRICNGQSKTKNYMLEIEQHSLRSVVEQISTQYRYPLLALRVLLHVITGMDADGRITISARQLAKRLDVNYDTVTKCLKDLREMDILQLEHRNEIRRPALYQR